MLNYGVPYSQIEDIKREGVANSWHKEEPYVDYNSPQERCKTI
jgi:hypothetical protein